MTNLGQLIHMERTKRQESQETLAKAIGVSRQTVLNWEKGRTLPDSASLVGIAQRYQLSFDQLIGLQVKAKKSRVWINYLILLILFSLGIFVGGNATLLLPFLIVFFSHRLPYPRTHVDQIFIKRGHRMVRKDRLFIAFIVLGVLSLLVKLHRYLGFSPIHSLYYQLASFVLLFTLGIYHYRKLLWTDFGKMWSWKLLYQFPLFYLADFLVMYGGSFLQYLIVKSFHISEGIGNVTAVNKISQIVPLSIFLLIVGIIGPIVEELFYRKFLQDSLKNVLNPWFAIVLQGLIFGLGHAKSLDSSEIINTIPQICSGIYLGYLYHRTGNLCYPMLVHCASNLSVGY